MNFPEKYDHYDFLSFDCILNQPGDSIVIIGDLIKSYGFVLLVGIAGIGKTALAIEYARSKDSVLINCSSNETVKAHVDKFLSLVENPNSLEESFNEFKIRLRETTKKYLFILDDIKDYDIINNLMPSDRSKDFEYILTSRNTNFDELNIRLDKKLIDNQILKLKMFNIEKATELLSGIDATLAENLISLIKSNENPDSILPQKIDYLLKYTNYFEFFEPEKLFELIKLNQYDNGEHTLLYDLRVEEEENDKWCFLKRICVEFDGNKFNFNVIKNMGYDENILKKHIHDLNNFSLIEEITDDYIKVPLVVCEEIRRFIKKNSFDEENNEQINE